MDYQTKAEVMRDSKAHEQPTLFPLSPSRPDTLTIREAAVLMGVHPRTIQKYLANEELWRAPDNRIDPLSIAHYQHQQEQAKHKRTSRHLSHPQHIQLTPDQALALTERHLAVLQDMVHFLRDELAAVKAAHQKEREEFKAREQDLLAALKVSPRANLPRYHQLPTPGTLLDRVYQYLLHANRPKRVWQVRQALSLPKSPGRELDRLVDRRLARRLRPGLFQALGSPAKKSTPPASAPPSLLESVYRVVAEAGHPLSSAAVQAKLHSTRRLNQELSKLVKQKRLCRITQAEKREGLYCVP